MSAALSDLRTALRGELDRVSARLERIDEMLADVATGVASVAVRASDARDGPLTAEQLRFWAARSRSADAGERFSALVQLGGERSELGVEVCLERLADDAEERPIVLWQALRNLGQYGETDSAPQVAVFLDHDEVVVRDAAYRALLLMGAPEDTGFDATAPAGERAAATQRLRTWADEI